MVSVTLVHVEVSLYGHVAKLPRLALPCRKGLLGARDVRWTIALELVVVEVLHDDSGLLDRDTSWEVHVHGLLRPVVPVLLLALRVLAHRPAREHSSQDN